MRLTPALALAAGLYALVGGAAAADEKADTEALKSLEGTYLLVGLEGKGLNLNEEQLKKVDDSQRKVVIKGDQIIATKKGKEDPAKIKVDASKTPPHITITSTEANKTEVNYGVYKLENGVLTIAATAEGDEKSRPADFKSGDKVYVMKLKKQ